MHHLHPFPAASEGSIPLEEGEDLWLIEKDQGDGWTRWAEDKVMNESEDSLLFSEFGGWMCLIWTRCLRVLFQHHTLRPRKCLISPSLSEDRQMNIMQLSVKIVSKNHIVYTKLPAHPAMLNHVIILSSWWKLVQKPTLSQICPNPAQDEPCN